jgi:hypothetical protein
MTHQFSSNPLESSNRANLWTYQQKYSRIYDYIHEYQRLIYDFYSKGVVAFLTTYYHINTEETVWDDENMMGGAYDQLGELSGIRWDKFLLIPVYYIEEVQTPFDAQETGLIKENETQFVIPSSYGFTPLVNDKFKMEQEWLKPTNDTYPIFNVTGIEKSVNADRLFWRLKVEVFQSATQTQLDLQVVDVYTFYEYDKLIHTIDDAQFLTNLLTKNDTLRDRCKQELFDCNSGFYLV